MRRGSDPELVYDDDGEVVAVNLSADFTAEHEWGIDGLKRAFGIRNDGVGLARRGVTRVPALPKEWTPGLHDFTIGDGWGFAYCRRDVGVFKDELRRHNNMLSAAWDGDTFAVVAWDKSAADDLKEVYAALQRQDACILRGGVSFIDNPGLIIAIASRLPKSVTDVWESADRERHDVQQLVEQTGIEKRLSTAGKGYFALQPKRQADGGLVFWLNPMEQDKNNFGWFTLENLDDWIKGRGPIPRGKR